MSTVRRCRACKAPKWGSDPCPNAECPTTRTNAPLRSKTPPVAAAVKHGYHANVTGVTSLVSDYDRPISARSKWIAARGNA